MALRLARDVRFADVLQCWIDAHGMAQADLAARVGTTQATISRYLAGALYPSVPVALRLRAVTGIDLAVMVRPTRAR